MLPKNYKVIRATASRSPDDQGLVPPTDLKKTRQNWKNSTSHPRDIFTVTSLSEVHAEFIGFARDFDNVSVLPTPAFFYGLQPGEEIAVDIEAGKTLFIQLINVGDVQKDGTRSVTFELNGITRQVTVVDRSVQTKVESRDKADPANPLHIGAPIPGMVTSIACSVGAKVAKGEKLLTLEAMKMHTSITSPADGVVQDIYIQVGDTVESKDLLVRLRNPGEK